MGDEGICSILLLLCRLGETLGDMTNLAENLLLWGLFDVLDIVRGEQGGTRGGGVSIVDLGLLS